METPEERGPTGEFACMEKIILRRILDYRLLETDSG
jgi:hypothetical protein